MKLYAYVALCLLLVHPASTLADELSQLKEDFKALQLHLIKMQAQIDSFESKKKSSPEVQVQDPDLTERVETLEEDLATISEEHDSTVAKLAERVEVDLYATLEFENFENTDSTFDARNVELFLQGQISDRLRAAAEIEYERTAKTSDGSRQGEVEVEQGWLEYSINRYLNPRAGVVLVPFGKYNIEHFANLRDLTSRPVAMRRIVPTTWAEAGAGITGTAFVGDSFETISLEDLTLDYQLYFINGLTDELSDRGLRDARGAFGEDNNNNKALTGRLGISPLPEQEIGLSGYFGSFDRAGNDINGFDVDWDFKYGPAELIGEWAFWDLDSEGVEVDGTTSVPGSLHGGYVQTNYHFWFEFLDDTFLAREFESPTFTASIRYGEAEAADDGDEGFGDNNEQRWTFGLNYRPVESWVFAFEYQINNGENERFERGDNNGFLVSVSGAL